MRMMKTILFALLLAVSAFPQAGAINGEIVGTITDASGAPVPNATVTASNAATGYRQRVVTSDTGLYRLPLLPLGTYEVRAELGGFTAYRQTGIALSAGATATIDITLQVGGVSTEVTVAALAPIIDASRTEQGSVLGANAILNLPLVSRNPFNFILQQPNVSGRGNTEFGVPRKLNANGFNGRINYQLDGSNNVQSDRAGIRLMPISNTWVQEVQQVSNGFAPEFGNTVGTVFNSITRSGANDLHGEAAYLFRRTPMSARPALLAENRPTPEVNVDSYFANAGGRVVKDRVFWFGGFESVKRDLPQPVAVPAATIEQLGLPASYADAIPFSQKVKFFIAKMDAHLTEAHRLSLRYNHHRNDSPYNSSSIGGLFLVDRTYTFVDRSHAGAAQLISVLSPNAVNELRVQVPFRSQQQNRFEATGTGPAVTISNVANFGNSLDVGFLYDEITPEVSENFTLNRGSHSFRVGGSLRNIRDTKTESTSALYTFSSVAAYLAARNGSAPRGYATFTQSLGEPSIKYNSTFTSIYGQDTWKPRSNITLIYGLRYDVYAPPSANENSPFEWSRKFRTDRNNFGPRVGVAIGFRKSTLRASTGVFYDPFQTDMYRRALLNNGTPQFFSVSATPSQSFAPSFPNVFAGIPQGFTLGMQDTTTVSPDFANLYSTNANVSFSRAITDNTALTVSYLYTRGNRLPIYRNINLGRTGQVLGDGRPVLSTANRPLAGYGNIIAVESVGQSVYNGLNVTLDRRFSRGFQVFGTYTWSHAIDDAPEQNNIDLGNGGLSDPTNRRADRGNSLTDRRHVFNGNAVFTPTFTLSNATARYLANNNRLALTFVHQSGEVFNIGSNRNLNGDPTVANAFQRPLFVGRNTLRAPRTSELNARYTRVFPVTESKTLEFIAESTNVFNRTNVTGLNSNVTVDVNGAITAQPTQAWTGALDQRLIQLGARFSF